ncbi:hypothetical protein BDZ89DRAFT_669149 [Hymenopellis radicata]|nr:hypothetical protein BDZ89DRAFT_669149 [Hymenopellis radicata]
MTALHARSTIPSTSHIHNVPMSNELDIERLKTKAIAASTFDAEAAESFNAILLLVHSDCRLFHHFAEVAKNWFERPLTMQGGIFHVQSWSAGLIYGLIDGFCDEPTWPADRLVQMKALWPHLGGWIQRLCECFLQLECTLPLDYLDYAFYYVSSFITRFIGSPMDVDFRCRFDKDGHFWQLICARSFLDPIIKAWVRSSSSIRHRTIFNLLGGVMKAIDNFGIFTCRQGELAFMQTLDALGPFTSDATSLIPSLQPPIRLSPIPSDLDAELTLLYLALTSRSSLTFRREYLRLGFVQHVCDVFLYVVSTLRAPPTRPNLLRIAPPPSGIDSVTFFHPRGAMLVGYCIRIISCFLEEGQRWIIKALRSSLLEALCRLEYWAMHYPRLMMHHGLMIAAMWSHITCYVVHPLVFKAVRRSLDSALRERKIPMGVQSRCIVDAIGFLCMEMERLAPAMAAVKGKVYSCSNEECNQTGVTRRCDCCELNFYCSRKCQRDDWKRHREECSLHAELYRRGLSCVLSLISY